MDIIQFLYSLIGTPLGYILYFIYQFVVSNVGIAILLFTFIVKLAMLPLSIKQQKNTARSAIFAPKVREIQQKYKNNQEKQQEELQKLQQQGYNPMGGCGSMILTFLLLFGVLDVVYKPMTHITHTPSAKVVSIIEESYKVELTELFVNEVTNKATDLKGDALKKHEDITRDAQKIINYYNAKLLAEGDTPKDMSLFTTVSAEAKNVVTAVITESMKAAYAADDKAVQFTATDLYKLTSSEKKEMEALPKEEQTDYKNSHSFGDKTRDAMSTIQTHFGFYQVSKDKEDVVTVSFQTTKALQRELYALETFGTGDNRMAYSESVIGKELGSELYELYGNLNFIGIPLGQVPWDNLGWPIILIPILSFIFSLLQTFIQNKHMADSNPEAANMGSMKIMMWTMPIVSLVLVFSVPAGAGFYWTLSYAFGIIQTLVLNKLFSPEKLKAQAEAEYNERMKVINATGRVKQADENGLFEYNGEKLTQKEINRRKLAEARRQDALKYGEEYNEDNDD